MCQNLVIHWQLTNWGHTLWTILCIVLQKLHHSLLMLFFGGCGWSWGWGCCWGCCQLGMAQIHQHHGCCTLWHDRRGRPLWGGAPRRIVQFTFVWRIWQSLTASSFSTTEKEEMRKMFNVNLTKNAIKIVVVSTQS